MTTSVRPVKIVTDSNADIPADLVRDLGIHVIPLLVQIGGKVYRDKVDLSGEDFYRLMEETRAVPTTSQPPPGEIVALFHELTADGSDVVAIVLSSALSGTYSTCCLAADSPDLRPGSVCVIDSQAVSMCLGWQVIFAAQAAQAGQSQAEIVRLVEDMIPRVRILGVLDTLEWLQRGGRIGLAKAFMGTMLSVKPILHLKEGKAAPVERVRTKGKAVQRMVELVEEFGPLDALAVVHGDDCAEADKLRDTLSRFYPRDAILESPIGPALGSHVGPRAVGVCCVLKRA